MGRKKNKKTIKVKGKQPKKRNLIALAAITRKGAGAHEKKGYSRKVKHKNKESCKDGKT